MNSLKLLILLIVILFGIYLFQLRFQTRTEHEQDIVPTPSPKPTAVPSPTEKPANTSAITPFYQAPTSPKSSSNSSYQYPGSTSQGNGVYTTTDSPAKVTQWYKDAISRDGYSSTTVVQTSTNGVTYNKLVAAKSGKQISLEIKKSSDADTVTITVSE